MSALDLLERVTCEVGLLEVAFSCPTLVYGCNSLRFLTDTVWFCNKPGVVPVRMMPFEKEGGSPDDADGLLSDVVERGLLAAFGERVPGGKVGTLYVRQPWVTSPGRGVWGRFGLVIRCPS